MHTKTLMIILVALLATFPVLASTPEDYSRPGGALEGLHAWVSQECFECIHEHGVSTRDAVILTMVGGLLVELVEMEFLDAEGISPRDLAANAIGVLAGATGLQVRFQYAGHVRAPEDYKWWARIPLVPVNGQTNAAEIDLGSVTLGAKYRGSPADVTIGFACLPVLACDEGPGNLVPYVGYHWRGGFHGAIGYDDRRRKLELGIGHWVEMEYLGVGFVLLVAGGNVHTGITLFVR